LPAEYQSGGGSSNAFFVDAAGNVYGQATTSGGSPEVPVVWMVPEPSSLSVGILGGVAMNLRLVAATNVLIQADLQTKSGRQDTSRTFLGEFRRLAEYGTAVARRPFAQR